MQTIDVEFDGEDGVTLRGRLHLPDQGSNRPAITMAHGFAATIEDGLAPFARVFTEAGFVVLMHDHRGFGVSAESRAVISIRGARSPTGGTRSHSSIRTQPSTVIESAYGAAALPGGHALILASTDRRIKTVVAQVPTISGFEQSQRRTAPDQTALLEELFIADGRRRHAGGPPATIDVVAANSSHPAVYRTPDACSFYLQALPEPGRWQNSVTVRSSRAARMYELGQWVSRVSPTPC